MHEETTAANEESMAINEELQSTNEELVTSKEEMQSVRSLYTQRAWNQFIVGSVKRDTSFAGLTLMEKSIQS